MFKNLPITCVADAQMIGQAIAQSGMFGVNNDGAGTVIALQCYQRGMTLDEYERTWQFIQGKRSMKYDVMLAKLRDLGGDYEIVERSKERACIKLKSEGKDWKEFSLTMEEAVASGVALKSDGKTLKEQYKIRPEVMLLSKCVSNGVRLVEPRVNFGVYSSEEVEDFDEHEDREAPTSANREPVPFVPPASGQIGNQQAAAPAQAEQPKQPEQKAPAAPASNANSDPFASIPDDQVDYGVCPMGKNKGKRWEELPREFLDKVVADPKTLSKQHIDAVKAAIETTPF